MDLHPPRRPHGGRHPGCGGLEIDPDRLGGGDTWNAGFYYGLLTAGIGGDGIRKGVLVGDAATRIKQTLMFDLPIIDKDEVQALMRADVLGGGKRTSR